MGTSDAGSDSTCKLALQSNTKGLHLLRCSAADTGNPESPVRINHPSRAFFIMQPAYQRGHLTIEPFTTKKGNTRWQLMSATTNGPLQVTTADSLALLVNLAEAIHSLRSAFPPKVIELSSITSKRSSPTR
jgi:hypothetical protein